MKKVPSIKKQFPDFTDSSVCLWFKVNKMPEFRSTLFAINHERVDGSCNAHFQLLIFDNKFSISFKKSTPYFSDKIIKAKENVWTHACLLRRHAHNKLTYKYFLYVNATRVGLLQNKYHEHSGKEEVYIFNLGGELDLKGDQCIIKKEKKLFDGKISKVFMFDRLLSHDEIKLMYKGITAKHPIVDWTEFRGKADEINNFQNECELILAR